MYIIREEYLVGVGVEEKEARLGLVDFLRDWVVEVYEESSSVDSISTAGRIIRYRVEENQDILERVFREVVLVDMGDFWRAMRRDNGNRDDIVLYGIFCMMFSELDEDIEKEAVKFEGEIGFAPQLRVDIAEREQKESESGGIFNLFNKKGNKEEEDQKDQKEEVIKGEEEVIEIEDDIVREDNVQLLTKLVVGVIVLLIIIIAWVVII